MPLPLPSKPAREKIWNRLVERLSTGLKLVEGSEPHATITQLFPIPLELIYEVRLHAHYTKDPALTLFSSSDSLGPWPQ